MNRYEAVVVAILRGDTREQVAKELGISLNGVSAIVKRLRNAGIDIKFRTRAGADLAGARAVWKRHLAEAARNEEAHKMTKAQQDARDTTLRLLREMYADPTGTYEVLYARSLADAENQRPIVSTRGAPPQPSPAVVAKLDALFKEE